MSPSTVGLGLLLLLVVWFIYGRTLTMPYVQDDIRTFYVISLKSPGAVLSGIFHPAHRVMYRPVTGLYFFALSELFGLDPTAHHLFTLLLQWATALVVVALGMELFRHRTAAWVAGFFYAAAVGIHYDSMIWASGMSTRAGVFFYLLALLFYLRQRNGLSGLAFMAAMLSRDDTVTLLAVVVWAACLGIGARPGQRPSVRLMRLWPQALALGFYVFLRYPVDSPTALGASHPYHVGVGARTLTNMWSYAGWLLQGVLPLFHHRVIYRLEVAAKVLLPILGLLLLVAARVGRGGVSAPGARRRMLFFGGWAVLALGPALALPNHAYRYYAIYALPAAILLYLALVQSLPAWRPALARRSGLVLVLLALVQVVFSARFYRAELAMGIRRIHMPGTNNLIRKCATVTLVREGLRQYVPELPHGARVLFEGVQTAAFARSKGLRLWYHDRSLWAFEFEEVKQDARGPYVWDEQSGRKVYLRPRNSFAFVYDWRSFKPLYLPRGRGRAQ